MTRCSPVHRRRQELWRWRPPGHTVWLRALTIGHTQPRPHTAAAGQVASRAILSIRATHPPNSAQVRRARRRGRFLAVTRRPRLRCRSRARSPRVQGDRHPGRRPRACSSDRWRSGRARLDQPDSKCAGRHATPDDPARTCTIGGSLRLNSRERCCSGSNTRPAWRVVRNFAIPHRAEAPDRPGRPRSRFGGSTPGRSPRRRAACRPGRRGRGATLEIPTRREGNDGEQHDDTATAHVHGPAAGLHAERPTG